MAEPQTIVAAIQALAALFGGNKGDSAPSKAEFLAGITVLNQQIDDIHGSIGRDIGHAIRSVIQTGSNVHFAVARNIDQQTNILTPIIQGGFQAILGAIRSGNGNISSQDTQAIQAVLQQILGNTNVLLSGQQDIVDQILNPTLGAIHDLDDDLFALRLAMDEGFSGIFAILDDLLLGANQSAEVTINNQIVIDASIYGAVLTTVEGILGSALAAQQGIVDGLSGTFAGVVSELIGLIALDDTGDRDQLKRIADVMELLKNPSLENLEKMGSGDLDGFGGNLGQGFLGSLGQYFSEHRGSFNEQFNRLVFGHDHPRDKDTCGLASWDDTYIDNDVPNVISEVLIWAVTALMVPLNASQVKANRVMQDYRQCFPDMLLQSGDIIGAWYKGLIDDNKALTDLEKQGFTHDDAEILLTSSETFPTIDLIFSMFFRNEIDEATKDNYLRGLGYGKFSREKLSKIAFFIPPVQDLITMAVREVFTPEVARANGQFDDFPPAFGEWARQQGVSEEWAQNYWAAHWQLPSPQMGFEMFHRQEISEERLRSLLVALDVMPGWRDEMIAISYNPLTRVDVRRMHALGVLDDAQVEKAYRDIGYSPDNAALMLDFTKRYNEDEDLITLDVASDLTRSNIVSFYEDGIIDRTIALGLLLQAGINAIASELFLDAADLDIERKERKDQIGLIMDKFRHGVFNFSQASDALTALGLEERERNLASIELVKTKQAITKIPSRADLDRFIKSGVISGELYLETMELNGYSRQWAEKYLLLASGVENGTEQ